MKMKVYYEQGDIVLDKETMSFAIVLEDKEDINRVKAITTNRVVSVEYLHRDNVEYVGEVDLLAEIKRIVKNANLIKDGEANAKSIIH